MNEARSCLVEGCEKQWVARQLCRNHYNQWNSGILDIQVPRAMTKQQAGAIGGKNGNTGGWASMLVGPDGLTGPQRASIAGQRGGRISRRKAR